MKRVALLALGAAALGACDYGLAISPDPAEPGDEVTITNAPDGPTCVVPDGDESTPVEVVILSGAPESEDDFQVVETTTDAEGYFSVTMVAPDRPGEHLVIAGCGQSEEPPLEELQALAAAPVDEDGTILDSLRVLQDPLTIALDKTTAKVGDEVLATFSWCQAENFDLLADGLGAAHADDEVTPEEVEADHPDLVVYLDGEPVATVAGEERHPTGPVKVPVELTSAGRHEIKGVCTYQTVDIDVEQVVELINEDGPLLEVEGGSVGAAHLDYPVVVEGGLFVFDEATTEAAATVDVGAVDAGGAVPVPAQPAFTG